MDTTFYFNTGKNQNYMGFAKKLNELIECELNFNMNREEVREIVYLCIGSDRSTGDSLGPLVGHRLSKLCSFDAAVYGTLKNPVHAVNLSRYMEDIYNMYRNPFVIAIDASLGSKNHIGYVTLTQGALKPGLGVKKQLQAVGDLSITGIVNFSGILDTMVLQSTRLSTVMELSEYISNGIATAAHMRRKQLEENLRRSLCRF